MENEWWNTNPRLAAELERVQNEQVELYAEAQRLEALRAANPAEAERREKQLELDFGADWEEQKIARAEKITARAAELQNAIKAEYLEQCRRDPGKLLRDAAAALASTSKEEFEAGRRGEPSFFGSTLYRDTQLAPGAAFTTRAITDFILSPQIHAAHDLESAQLLRDLDALAADRIEALGYPRPEKSERRAAIYTPGDKALEKSNSRDRAQLRKLPIERNGRREEAEVLSIIADKPFPAFNIEKNGRSREVSLAQIPPNIRGFFLDPTHYKGRLKFNQLPMNADKLWRLTRERLAVAENKAAPIRLTLEEFVNVCGLAGKDREAQRAAAKEAADALSCFRLVLEGWANLAFVDIAGFDPRSETFTIHIHAYFLTLALAARPRLFVFQSRALFALQECDRPSYFMGREMETHASIDKNRLHGNAQRLAVGTLLDASGLPRLRELKTEKRKWRERIKRRFEEELDKLLDARKYPDRRSFLWSWEYCAPGKELKPLPPEEVEKLDYDFWRKLVIHFKLREPFPESEEARFEKKREKWIAGKEAAASIALPNGWGTYKHSPRRPEPTALDFALDRAFSPEAVKVEATAEPSTPAALPIDERGRREARLAELEKKLAAETDPATRKAIEATIELLRKKL